MGNMDAYWIEFFHKDVVTAAFAQLRYPFGRSQFKNNSISGGKKPTEEILVS